MSSSGSATFTAVALMPNPLSHMNVAIRLLHILHAKGDTMPFNGTMQLDFDNRSAHDHQTLIYSSHDLTLAKIALEHRRCEVHLSEDFTSVIVTAPIELLVHAATLGFDNATH